MKELSLHLLDIAENSVAAGATQIRISVDEDVSADRLGMRVEDNGRGMDAQTAARVIDPFFTSRSTRKVGLGIPLLKAAAEACGGYLQIDSTPGAGTTLAVEFQHSHIDRMPLGDLAGTWLALLISAPQINWLFEYQAGAERFLLESAEITAVLGDVPLTEPDILAYLRETIQDGLAACKASPAAAAMPARKKTIQNNLVSGE